jgi:hypothetical protein
MKTLILRRVQTGFRARILLEIEKDGPKGVASMLEALDELVLDAKRAFGVDVELDDEGEADAEPMQAGVFDEDP